MYNHLIKQHLTLGESEFIKQLVDWGQHCICLVATLLRMNRWQ